MAITPKFISALLAFLMMAFVFCGCAKTDSSSGEPTGSSGEGNDTQNTEAETFFDVLSAEGVSCKVYYPNGAAQNVVNAALQIAAYVGTVSKTKITPYTTNFIKDENEAMILVGDTGREESNAFYGDLRYSDYGFRVMCNNVLCVGGQSDSGMSKSINLLCGILNDSSLLQEKTAADGTKVSGGRYLSSAMNHLERGNYNIQKVTLLSRPLSDFVIVYGTNSDDKAIAEKLSKQIAVTSGVCLRVRSSKEAPVPYEILVGNTARELSQIYYSRDYYKALNQYRILASDTSVALAGMTIFSLETALDVFCNQYFPQNQKLESVNIDASCAQSGKLDSTKANIQNKVDNSDIRIVSQNVYFWNFTEARVKLFIESVATMNADVLMLQEVSSDWHRTVDSKLEQIGYTAVPTRGSGDMANVTAKENYTPIWFRADILKLLDYGYDQFESVKTRPDGDKSSSKSFTWALFENKASGKKFISLSTHYTWHAVPETANRLRTEDAKEVMAQVAKLEAQYGVPVIVMGDMNCTSGADPYIEMTHGNLRDARSYAEQKFNTNLNTWHDLNENPLTNGTAIDHCFVSKTGVIARLYQVLCNDLIIRTSDHLPIAIDISLQ